MVPAVGRPLAQSKDPLPRRALSGAPAESASSFRRLSRCSFNTRRTGARPGGPEELSAGRAPRAAGHRKLNGGAATGSGGIASSSTKSGSSVTTSCGGPSPLARDPRGGMMERMARGSQPLRDPRSILEVSGALPPFGDLRRHLALWPAWGCALEAPVPRRGSNRPGRNPSKLPADPIRVRGARGGMARDNSY